MEKSGLEAKSVVKVRGTGCWSKEEKGWGEERRQHSFKAAAGKRCGGQEKEEQVEALQIKGEFPVPKGPSAVGQAASWNEGSSVAGGFQARIGSHLAGIVRPSAGGWATGPLTVC